MIGTKRIRLELALQLAKMAEDGGDVDLAIELLRRADGDTLVSANRILDIQLKAEGKLPDAATTAARQHRIA